MRLYGLIGRKLSHSFSAKWFNEKFGIEKIDAEYRLFPLADIGELRGLLDSIPEIEGLNVTIPYKTTVMPLLDHIDPEAQEIGAVNVLQVERDEGGNIRLSGYNSDIYGFRESLFPLLCQDDKKAIVLGTGGASKAVRFVLQKLGLEVILVSRKKRDDKHIITYQQLKPEDVKDADIIVNATPSGMFPDIKSYPDIPYYAISPDTICYDLVYNPEVTQFLKRCAVNGGIVRNGMEMLHLQAERAWEIWETNRKMFE